MGIVYIYTPTTNIESDRTPIDRDNIEESSIELDDTSKTLIGRYDADYYTTMVAEKYERTLVRINKLIDSKVKDAENFIAEYKMANTQKDIYLSKESLAIAFKEGTYDGSALQLEAERRNLTLATFADAIIEAANSARRVDDEIKASVDPLRIKAMELLNGKRYQALKKFMSLVKLFDLDTTIEEKQEALNI